jgi:2,5-diamino-6-(ribosylamino)-4(3H)-pyrimidinone 5'-phosphate reductase
VLDSGGRTPRDAAIFDGDAETIVVTSEGCSIDFEMAEVIRCGKGRVDLTKLMSILHERGHSNALVEGGGNVIWAFFREQLVDEFKVFVGSMIIGGEGSPTPADGEGLRSISEVVKLELAAHKELGDGLLLEYVVSK